MESRISLALASKLRMIFEKEDKYLTFPLGIGFTYKYLNFMKDPSVSGLTLQEHLNNKGDFARLLNIIPDDSPCFTQDASQFLWDALINVLMASSFAESALTEPEEKLLNQAIDFLTDPQTLEDGTVIPVYSVAVNKYYEYKTIVDQIEATYLNEKITVESSTGAEGNLLKQQWSTYREKQLLDMKQQAEDNWKNLGFREQTKYFQQVKNELESKKFLNLYKLAYLNEVKISETPDLNGMGVGFYTTFFSPFDAFEASLPWTQINLLKSEINTLVRDAPSDLKAIFNDGEGSDDIESVSLEYNNIVVMRPWYKSEFFASRYWKLTDNTIISDGKIPRHGKIPSYITSMIVVRNVVVTRKKAVQNNPIVLPILTKIPIQTFKIKKLQIDTPPIIIKPATESKAETSIAVDTIKRSQLNTSTVKSSTLSLSQRPTTKTDVTSSAPIAPISKSSFVRESLLMSSVKPIVIAQKESQSKPVLQGVRYIAAKYLGTTIKSPRLQIPPKKDESVGSTGSSVELVTECFNFDGVVVLAYVCKRVPKCPDPDPTLRWV